MTLNVQRIHQALEELKALPAAIQDLERRLSSFETYLKTTANNVPVIASTPAAVATAVAAASKEKKMIRGINIPWVDFGNDIMSKPEWGKDSLNGSPENRLRLLERFKIAKAEGFDVVRFWLFPSLWHQEYDEDEITASVIWLLDIAVEAEVLVMPTIFSFDNWSIDKGDKHNAVPLTEAMINKIVPSIIEGLETVPEAVYAVDLINEPEWAVNDMKDADPDSEVAAISLSRMQKLIGLMTELFAFERSYPLVVGGASPKWDPSRVGTDSLSGLGELLDTHHYEGWSAEFFPLETWDMIDRIIGETDVPWNTWDKYEEAGILAMFFWPKHFTDKALQDEINKYKTGS